MLFNQNMLIYKQLNFLSSINKINQISNISNPKLLNMKTFLFVSFILLQTISLSIQGGPTVKDGKYFIINKQNCDVLDIEKGSKECGANVIVKEKDGSESQQFCVENIYQNYVTLTNVNSKLTLTVENKKLGSKIEQLKVDCYPNAYQLFKFIEVCDNYYLIYN